MPLTYANYLKLNDLLDLQVPLSQGPEHDELLFIVIHQVYELWFKQILHEADYLAHLLGENDTARAQHTLTRILKILKVQVAQLDILETMTPLEFRELEFTLGRKSQGFVEHFPQGTEAHRRLLGRYEQPCLWDVFLSYIAANGYAVPADVLNRDVTQPVTANQAVQRVLVDVYRNDAQLVQVCELLVDLDEGLQEWRYRHVKMVERTIGNKMGTGGSSGVGYLSSTLFQPVFPDLWAIRTEL